MSKHKNKHGGNRQFGNGQVSHADYVKGLMQKMTAEQKPAEAGGYVDPALSAQPAAPKEPTIDEQSQKILDDAKGQAEQIKAEAEAQARKVQKDAEDAANVMRQNAQEQIDLGVKEKLKEHENEMAEEKAAADRDRQEAASLLAVAKEKDKQISDMQGEVAKERAETDAEKETYRSQVKKELLDSQKELEDKNKALAKEAEEAKKRAFNLQVENDEATSEAKSFQDGYNKLREKLKDFGKLTIDYQEAQSVIDDLTKTRDEIAGKLAQQKALLIKYGENPDALLAENQSLVKENKDLRDQLADMPSKAELAKLRSNAELYEKLLSQYEELNQQATKDQAELNELRAKQEENENYRKFIKIQEQQKRDLQDEINRLNDEYSSNAGAVFPRLSKIDKEKPLPVPTASGIPSLRLLCDGFRSYLANRDTNPLYYSQRDIRTFVAGLEASRLLILEGLSGTGKSSLPQAFADYTGCRTNLISVQSSWKDRNDLLGFYNDFKKQYKETEFLETIYRAVKNPGVMFIVVLDEMNLSRIEYYFNDFLSEMEKASKEDQKIRLLSENVSEKQLPSGIDSDGELRILDNLWFVGTANKDDSTFIITDKVYDRAIVIGFTQKGKYEAGSYASKYNYPLTIGKGEMIQLLSAPIARFKNKAEMSKNLQDTIDFLDGFIRDPDIGFGINFGNRIANQLTSFVPVYMECCGNMDDISNMYEAVDIIFARKVIRKLEGLYDEKTKDNINTFIDEIKKKYPAGAFELTISALSSLRDKI
jgi:hypothetical protein